MGANSMAESGLCGRKVLVGTGRAISVVFGINGLRSRPSCFVGPPFPAYMARWQFPRRLDCKFINWWVWLSISVGAVWSSVKPGNRTENRVCLID